MKPENKHTQAIHVQSHDWATENQQLRKELLSREKRIEELEAMASTLNNQLSEKIDQINDLMQKMISFMTTNGDATLLDSLRQSVVAEIRAEFEVREQKLKEAYFFVGQERMVGKANAGIRSSSPKSVGKSQKDFVRYTLFKQKKRSKLSRK